MSDTACPFKVGDRVHELAPLTIYCQWGMGKDLVRDETRPDAIVTGVTERGFTYEYTCPIPHGRAAWGQMMVGGECFPEGYGYWVKVD
jgi:hypothetical protein